MTRILAIDWSGALAGAHKSIRLAEARDGELVRVEGGRGREEVIRHLIEAAREDPDIVVGLDFAFSFPDWFLRQLQVEDARGLWRQVWREGEAWLAACDPPFWGRLGRGKPAMRAHLRRTEQECAAPGHTRPKSVFQIGGAGAVGTGSIRGMPFLGDLAEAGFAIWPFDAPRLPLVVEIYPRLLTGPVIKSDAGARIAFLEDRFPDLEPRLRDAAGASEDAFDAAVSALVMARHVDELTSLPKARDAADRLEGRIWIPGTGSGAPRPDKAPAYDDSCPFCRRDLSREVAASSHAVALRDAFPLSEGHTLVVPRRHVGSLFDLPSSAQADVWRLVGEVRDALAASADAFNIGVNDGEAAGQTVPHAHVHIIPRHSGDVADPRGGIRWVLPERAVYWDE
jgi:diadenosine tetraphosphate (Ap4A) HIT family hydrolase